MSSQITQPVALKAGAVQEFNMENYKNLLARILAEGKEHTDRTGVGTVRIFGAMLEFDLAEGFPVLTLRKIPWRSAIAEMIGFVNGFNRASQFEELGCKFWRANAEAWPGNSDGDHLGRIYGVQARRWIDSEDACLEGFDQLGAVLDELQRNPDSRRLLVTHWRPDEFEYMALPPCHVQYQFLADKDAKELSLKFDMRSTDMVLGAPNNIIGYAWLLSVVAHGIGYAPRKLIMTMGDCHIYKDHIEGVKTMLERPLVQLPLMKVEKEAWLALAKPEAEIPLVRRIEALRPGDFELLGYEPHDPISFKMAV